MYVGLLPTWGDKWNDANAVFDERNAEEYGRFIAERYRRPQRHLDPRRRPQSRRRPQARRRTRHGAGHPQRRPRQPHNVPPHGWRGSASGFTTRSGCRSTPVQNGHTPRYQSYHNTLVDYRRAPAKTRGGHRTSVRGSSVRVPTRRRGALHRRRRASRSLLGRVQRLVRRDVRHHSVWQMYDPDKGRAPVNRPLMPWRDALDRPAATQADICADSSSHVPISPASPRPTSSSPTRWRAQSRRQRFATD